VRRSPRPAGRSSSHWWTPFRRTRIFSDVDRGERRRRMRIDEDGEMDHRPRCGRRREGTAAVGCCWKLPIPGRSCRSQFFWRRSGVRISWWWTRLLRRVRLRQSTPTGLATTHASTVTEVGRARGSGRCHKCITRRDRIPFVSNLDLNPRDCCVTWP